MPLKNFLITLNLINRQKGFKYEMSSRAGKNQRFIKHHINSFTSIAAYGIEKHNVIFLKINGKKIIAKSGTDESQYILHYIFAAKPLYNCRIGNIRGVHRGVGGGGL